MSAQKKMPKKYVGKKKAPAKKKVGGRKPAAKKSVVDALREKWLAFRNALAEYLDDNDLNEAILVDANGQETEFVDGFDSYDMDLRIATREFESI